jgi:hypothetical protein
MLAAAAAPAPATAAAAAAPAAADIVSHVVESLLLPEEGHSISIKDNQVGEGASSGGVLNADMTILQNFFKTSK